MKLKCINYKYKCQDITGDIQRYLIISEFLISISYVIQHTTGNNTSVSCRFVYNEKQVTVTELDTVKLPIIKNVYLIQLQDWKTIRIYLSGDTPTFISLELLFGLSKAAN